MDGENTHILKRENPEYNNVSKIAHLNISPSYITIEKVLFILRKHISKRTTNEISLIKSYILNISKLPNKFIQEHIHESSYEKIIILSSPFVEYKYIKEKKTVIYKGNDEAHYLYIVLRGSVMIQNIVKINKMMNGYEYYLLLIKLKNQKEYYLLEKTIIENYSIFPFNKEDIFDLEKIFLKLLLLKIEDENNPDIIDDILMKSKLKYSDFGIESYREKLERIRKENIENEFNNNKQINNKEVSIFNVIGDFKNNLKTIKQNVERIPIKKCKSYYFFLIESYKIKVFNFEYKDFQELKTHDYFGDFENGKYKQKAYTISNEADLLLLKTEVYKNFIKSDMKKIIEDEVNFLLKNYFFKSIIKSTFDKFYFRLFETVIYQRGQNIFFENEKVDYIYFIKEGEIKLTSNRSVLENHVLIKLIEKKINIKEKYPNDINSITNFPLYDIKNSLKVRKEFQIFMVYNNDSLGIESVQFALNYLYNAIVFSKKAKLYRINIEQLMKIFKDKNEEASYDFRENAQEKLKMLYNRLININTMLITLIERKYDIIFNKNDKKKTKYQNDFNIKNVKNDIEKNTSSILPKLLKNNNKSNIKLSDTKHDDNLSLTKNQFHFNEFKVNYSLNHRYLKKSISEIINIPSYEERFLNKIKKEAKESNTTRNTIYSQRNNNMFDNNKEIKDNQKSFYLTSAKKKSLLISYLSSKAYYDNPIYDTILNGNYNNFSYDFSKNIKTNEKKKLYSIFDMKKKKKKIKIKKESSSLNALYIENLSNRNNLKKKRK